MQPARLLRAALTTVLVATAAGCAIVPSVQQAFVVGTDGAIVGSPRPCPGVTPAGGAAALRGPEIRVVSWNLHKGTDPGWDTDLARFAATSDLLLLQEAVLSADLQRVLAGAGFDWLLAGAFALDGREIGVLSAARVPAASACVQRVFEPLLQLPKATLITRYALAGDATLAVANLHSINFTLGLGAYRAQLEALEHELAGHHGPVIVGGDFNSWSEERLATVHETMQRLGLASVLPVEDTRSRFLGRQVDFIFVRGLEVVHAKAPPVTSSDHNPMLATLRLLRAAP